jgi:hypothetical protein
VRNRLTGIMNNAIISVRHMLESIEQSGLALNPLQTHGETFAGYRSQILRLSTAIKTNLLCRVQEQGQGQYLERMNERRRPGNEVRHTEAVSAHATRFSTLR